ncbi:MAG: type II toxin-antitoxin system ParD family antitoxin [Oscillatoriales cyanobacterium RU_3_3]|nr:type II toxin-antitoxin system ParD family antitoxin [Oscillatoriales cyanobacterium RU_3_3]NJR21296.1 type II toxin-antitoxin system ParD family antitoxin [Richelia sp. CSU_2_1]
MNISLKPEQKQFIQSLVASGKFANGEEVIDTALRLLKKVQGEYEQWIEETREKIDLGIAQLDRGEGLDGEAVVARIRERFKKARQERE